MMLSTTDYDDQDDDSNRNYAVTSANTKGYYDNDDDDGFVLIDNPAKNGDQHDLQDHDDLSLICYEEGERKEESCANESIHSGNKTIGAGYVTTDSTKNYFSKDGEVETAFDGTIDDEVFLQECKESHGGLALHHPQMKEIDVSTVENKIQNNLSLPLDSSYEILVDAISAEKCSTDLDLAKPTASCCTLEHELEKIDVDEPKDGEVRSENETTDLGSFSESQVDEYERPLKRQESTSSFKRKQLHDPLLTTELTNIKEINTKKGNEKGNERNDSDSALEPSPFVMHFFVALVALLFFRSLWLLWVATWTTMTSTSSSFMTSTSFPPLTYGSPTTPPSPTSPMMIFVPYGRIMLGRAMKGVIPNDSNINMSKKESSSSSYWRIRGNRMLRRSASTIGYQSKYISISLDHIGIKFDNNNMVTTSESTNNKKERDVIPTVPLPSSIEDDAFELYSNVPLSDRGRFIIRDIRSDNYNEIDDGSIKPCMLILQKDFTNNSRKLESQEEQPASTEVSFGVFRAQSPSFMMTDYFDGYMPDKNDGKYIVSHEIITSISSPKLNHEQKSHNGKLPAIFFIEDKAAVESGVNVPRTPPPKTLSCYQSSCIATSPSHESVHHNQPWIRPTVSENTPQPPSQYMHRIQQNYPGNDNENPILSQPSSSPIKNIALQYITNITNEVEKCIELKTSNRNTAGAAFKENLLNFTLVTLLSHHFSVNVSSSKPGRNRNVVPMMFRAGLSQIVPLSPYEKYQPPLAFVSCNHNHNNNNNHEQHLRHSPKHLLRTPESVAPKEPVWSPNVAVTVRQNRFDWDAYGESSFFSEDIVPVPLSFSFEPLSKIPKQRK